MVWLLPLIAAICVILGFLGKNLGSSDRKKKSLKGLFDWVYTNDLENGFIGWGLTCLVVSLIILSSITFSHGLSVSEKQAFYEANTVNHQVTISGTAAYLTVEYYPDTLVVGSIERLEQAGHVSERLREQRDEVNAYNLELATMKRIDDSPFLGTLMPNEIQDLPFIILVLE